MAKTSEQVVVRIEVPQEKEQQGNALTRRAETTLRLAEDFKIVRPDDFELAGNELRGIASSIAALDAHRKDMTRPIDEAKAKIMDRFKPALALLENAKAILGRKMLEWRDEQERARRAEQARLEEAARKERERLEAEARKLAAKGKAEQAQATLAVAAQTVAPVPVAAPVPQVKGVSTRKTWRAECNDIIALCRAVIEGKVAPLAVSPNLVFLNEQARSLEQHFDARFPGCRAVPEEKFTRTRV